MLRASLTLTAHGDAEIRFPYSPDFIEDLKRHIPLHGRRWTPEGKFWWIGSAYVNLAARLAAGYFEVDHIAAHRAGQRAYTAPPPPPRPLHPDPYVTLHLLPSAPPELVEAATRTLAKLHHPDLKPATEKALATATMAKINRAAEDLRRRGVA